jgi:hypothetical protein
MLAKNSQKDFFKFLESQGINSCYTTPYEQLESQNGQAESSINALMTLAQSALVESGLGGQFWFRAASMAKDVRNVPRKESIKMTQYMHMYRKKKDISKFRAFGCQAYMYVWPNCHGVRLGYCLIASSISAARS